MFQFWDSYQSLKPKLVQRQQTVFYIIYANCLLGIHMKYQALFSRIKY